MLLAWNIELFDKKIGMKAMSKRRSNCSLPGLAVIVAAFLSAPPVNAVPVTFNFFVDVPQFEEPALAPLNALFTDNNITEVTGMVGWNTDDVADMGRSTVRDSNPDFLFMSNIDFLFTNIPFILVFFDGELGSIVNWQARSSSPGETIALELGFLNRPVSRWIGVAPNPSPPPDQIVEVDLTTFQLQEKVAVPEPSTLALMGLGVLGMAYWQRRKPAR